MSKYGYGSSPPKTKPGSYIEDAMVKGMILMMAGSPILILASGNVAGLLALPLLLLVPLVFTDTRRTSDQERKQAIIDPELDERLKACRSSEEFLRELSNSRSRRR